MTDRQTDLLTKQAVALKALRRLKLRDAVDPLQPDSRPTVGQQEVLDSLLTHRRLFVLGGNRSGKTMLLGRLGSWFFERDCPYFDIEAQWPSEPLLILVVARTSEQYTEIWEKKIQPFLAAGSYKEEKQGGVLQRIRHRTNGSKIIFQSHHNPNEAREKLQMFGAHLVLLDEQVDQLPLLEELIRRTTDTDGFFFNTMTPKIPAPAVKKYIESPHRLKKIFKLKMLDNPKIKGREQDVFDDIANLPLAMRLTILEGDWYEDSGKVYSYTRDLHQAPAPDDYSPNWRHAEFIDPAAAGKVGFGLAVENPRSGQWIVIRAKYFRGEAATDLLDKLDVETAGLNITHRVADPHEAWFLKEAVKRQRIYNTTCKDDRKDELIKGVSEALKAGWLKIAPGLLDLEDEFSEAAWSPTVPGKIVNGTKYHLLDALQYFVDTRPKFVPGVETIGVFSLLDLANKTRRKNEAKRTTKRGSISLKPAIKFRRSRWGRVS